MLTLMHGKNHICEDTLEIHKCEGHIGLIRLAITPTEVRSTWVSTHHCKDWLKDLITLERAPSACFHTWRVTLA